MAAPASGLRTQPRGRPGATLLAAALALLAAAAVATSGTLVAMTNDRDGAHIVSLGAVQGGGSADGAVTIGNRGLLPFRYRLDVYGQAAPGATLTVRRHPGRSLLYAGPLDVRGVPMDTLAPGQRQRLDLTVAVPTGAASPGQLTFVWSAGAALPPGWLLLAPLLVFLTVAAVLRAGRARRREPTPSGA